MRNKVLMLSLLSLCIVGCAAGGDKDDSNSSNDSSMGHSSSSSGDSKKEDEGALLQEIRSGFSAFMKKDSDITFDYTQDVSYVEGENEMGARNQGKGTLDRTNGYLYAKETTFENDETTGEEKETLVDLHYVGVVDSEYRYYYARSSEATYALADQYAAEYLYDESIATNFYTPVEGIGRYLEHATSISALVASLKYSFMSEASDLTCDVFKKDDVTTLTFNAKSRWIGDSYEIMSVDYEFSVKAACIESLSYAMSMESFYPNGSKMSQKMTNKFLFKKGFDNEFYSSFESDSSYTEDSNGMRALVDIYYGDYFYQDFSCYVGSDIDVGVPRSGYFEDFYYDKECTVPVSSKKFSSDVRRIYVKLRETTTTDRALIYVLTDATTVYLNDILPSYTTKTLKVWGPNTSYSFTLPWTKKYDDGRDAALETMSVNGVTTTDDSISLEYGKTYLVEHAYSTFSEA